MVAGGVGQGKGEGGGINVGGMGASRELRKGVVEASV